ncbi:hypothetical protein PROFUN_16296 [Planoprotostelium fungivorum]|uniref:Uncharacterized protein n=1 Tax=Planoprotostelium fungivorum TaxID=1890364 RepID=A0A2P6MR79_9EUKA|nr:hypothetical protein PROFUN_16296 [Planoprotostelium fungivorum]
MFLADSKRNTTLKAHPYVVPALLLRQKKLYMLLWCTKRALSTQFSPWKTQHTRSDLPRHSVTQLRTVSVQEFSPRLYKACSGRTKAYKCFAENLQTDHNKQAFSVW